MASLVSKDRHTDQKALQVREPLTLIFLLKITLREESELCREVRKS